MNNLQPAFPVHPDAHKCSDAECSALSGMTLRDYFAGRAMQGLVHDIVIDQPIENSLMAKGLKPEEFPGYLAHLAYRLAEAMLAERDKPVEWPTPYTPVPKGGA